MSQEKTKREGGFTLIELLIAIVVVGILAAVAIVGIGGLTGTGNKASCKASSDAATTASAAYYSNSINATPVRTPNWPAAITDLTGDGVFTAPAGANLSGGTTMVVGGWTLTLNGNGSAAPTFTCTTP